MNAKKMISAFAVLMLAVVVFTLVPVTGDDGAATDEKGIVYVHGDFTSSLTYTTEQTLVVDADLTIKDGATMEVRGDFIVNKGVTVTIMGASSDSAIPSKLLLVGDATIDGNIISETGTADGSKVGLEIVPEKAYNKVIINGTVTANGDGSGTEKKTAFMCARDGEIIVNGSIIVGTNAVVDFDETCIGDYIDFSAGSSLIVYGYATGDLFTSGYIFIDGKAMLDVYFKDDSAVVDIKGVNGYVTVCDKGMFAYAYGGVQYYVGLDPETDLKKAAMKDASTKVRYNWISLEYVTNVKVTEKVTTEVIYDDAASKNMMVAATETVVASLDSSKAVENYRGVSMDAYIIVTEGKTAYFETMTIIDVDFYVYGDTTIRGDVTYISHIAPGSIIPSSTIIVSEPLRVTGCFLLKLYDLESDSKVNVIAAYYVVKNAENESDYYYTTLQQAISSGAENITMLGVLEIEEDVKVPAGTKLTTAENLAQGEDPSAVIIEDGATFAIEDGAKFVSKGDVNVKGTLVIENMDNGIKFEADTKIWADVNLKDGSRFTYTNIYNGFATASAGAEINAYKPFGNEIKLEKDLTLPAGMSFDNTPVKIGSTPVKITVVNGTVFTVAGKLILSDDMKIDTAKKDMSTMDGGWHSSITKIYNSTVIDCSVLAIGPQGVIETAAKNGTIFKEYKIAGAYFENDKAGTDKRYYMSNASFAFDRILDANKCTVTLAGKVSIENLTVAGTEKERIIVNIRGGTDVSDIAMKGFTFSYGKVVANAGVKLTGDIGTATGKMIFNDMSVKIKTTFEDIFVDDAMNLEVRGQIKSDNATEVAGTVYMKGFVYDIATDSGPEYERLTYAEKRFTIPAGASVFLKGQTTFANIELLVAGGLTVMKGVTLDARTSYVSVLGKLTVSKVDNGYGEFKVANIIVGGSTDSFNNNTSVTPLIGNALVAGDGMFTINSKAAAYVFNGSSITASVLADWMDDTKNTEFYMDGSLWMTAYSGSGDVVIAKTTKTGVGSNATVSTEYPITPAVDNMKFNGWQTYDEKTGRYRAVVGDTSSADTAVVKVGDAGYTKVYADISKDVYRIYVLAAEGIDDVYMDGRNMVYGGTYFYAEVAVGSHTIGYNKANGYSGDAYISVIDGEKTSGTALTFTVDDDNYKEDGSPYIGDGMVISLTGVVKSGMDIDPETHTEESTGFTVAETLLIAVVIIMAVMAVVLILRLNRS